MGAGTSGLPRPCGGSAYLGLPHRGVVAIATGTNGWLFQLLALGPLTAQTQTF